MVRNGGIRMLRERDYDENLFKDLKIDCSKCFGLCCVALFFSKCDGFPINKAAGKPCLNLNSDFSCKIHQNLRDQGLKGCTTYDCFGAGQKVAQINYRGISWKEEAHSAQKMYDDFLVMRQLHEMMWYLTDASTFMLPKVLKEKVLKLREETIFGVNIEAHRVKVNACLKEVQAVVSQQVVSNSVVSGFDFIGKNLMKKSLRGANFAGSLLIAANLRNADLAGANFIGADLRDADLRGADLSECLFLTQLQVNSAKGNQATNLPKFIERPSYWEK